MTADDVRIIADAMIPVIKEYVDKALTPMVARNKELELRLLEVETAPVPVIPERGERGEPGQKGDTGISVASLVISADRRLIAHFSDGRMQDIGPAPQGVAGEKGLTGDRGERGDMGPAGKDAAPVDVDAIVSLVLEQLPAPVRGEKGETGLIGSVGPMGPQGEKGLDGVGITDALIDRHGHLVLTMSDGRTKDIGGVVGKDGTDGIGKDGAPGRDGHDVELSDVQILIAKELSTWPRPKDGRDGVDGKDGIGLNGKDGIDGKDGVGFDGVDLVFDEEKGYAFRLTSGDRVKDFPVPWPWDANVWQAGRTYSKSASVTWDGHFWIAQRENSEQPGEGSSAWRLAVRRGKQGKEGKPGKDATVVTRATNTPPLYGY